MAAELLASAASRPPWPERPPEGVMLEAKAPKSAKPGSLSSSVPESEAPEELPEGSGGFADFGAAAGRQRPLELVELG